MGLFGTTSNKNIDGYETSGDIENAGKLDKGFKRPDTEEVQASIKEDNSRSILLREENSNGPK